GYEATRVIRGLEAARGQKPSWIIALTANVMIGERERCLDAGCDLFLTKPIKKNRLMDEVRQLVESGNRA
ncbi:MAG: response regulator, partial [Magnetococcales bacterium]|nr:response regulator [Magnetococcales bacterium]